MNSKDNKSNSIFWIPMLYNFNIRLTNNPLKIISWLFINLFPTYYYALIFNDVTITSILILFVFTFGIFYQYEWGYIYNDAISIKKEKNPSVRLNENQIKYIKNHYNSIKLFRFSIFTLCMLSTLIYESKSIYAIIIAILCPIIFFIYNNWRSKYNTFLYIWLVTSRFIPFALLFNINNPLSIILLFMIYPLEIGIERFSMPKFRFKFIKRILPNEESKHRFRIIYYISTTILLSILYYTSHIDSIIYLIPYYIFTIYRCLILLKHKI